MRKLNHSGEINGLAIALVVVTLLFIGVGVGLLKITGKYKDARDNVDTKVATAVTKATDEQKKTLEDDFSEREKTPFASYESAAKYGSIKVTYSKVWSAYVEETDSQTPINGYFHPKFVPAVASKIKYALRLQLINAQYATSVKNFNDKVTNGNLKATPITINGVTGTRLDGKIDQETTGSIVELPIRDKTLKIWTESTDYRDDFDSIILKNLTFVP